MVRFVQLKKRVKHPWRSDTSRKVAENHAENVAEKLVQDLFLIFKKALHNVKANDLQPRCSIFL